MSAKHASLVLKSGKLKGNPLLMAVILALKAGSGKPFGNGKVIADGHIPKAPDKWLMGKMRVNRRESIRQWRKEVIASGLFTTTLVSQSDGWPVHSYQFSNASETAARDNTKSAARGRGLKRGKRGTMGEVVLPALPASQEDTGDRREGITATQCSTVQPCAGERAETPKQSLTGHEQEVGEAFKSWSRCTPEQVRRVAAHLSESDLEPFLKWLQVRGMGGGVWLVNKTKSRLDWLADRLESTDDHSALSQFTSWAMAHDSDGGVTPITKIFTEEEIDMDEPAPVVTKVSIKIEDV